MVPTTLITECHIGDGSDVTYLRGEDKEKLSTIVTKEERASSEEKDEKKAEEGKCREDLVVENATSNRSTCRKCNTKITRVRA